MKEFIVKHALKISGILTGAVGGYLYYYFIGCRTYKDINRPLVLRKLIIRNIMINHYLCNNIY